MSRETIIKIKKREHPFVQIDKRNLENKKLSWKAKGLLTYLISKPDDWKIYVSELSTRSIDGDNSVRAGLKELEKVGHLEKRRLKDKKGRFIGCEYMIYEDITEGGKKPYVEKPYMDKPYMDNRALLIKKDTNIYNTNKEREEKKLSPSKEMKLFLEDRKYIDKIAEILIKKSGASPNIVIGEILRFRSYWMEKNKSGTKQRWELQPTFELRRRLSVWFKNMEKFNRNKEKKIII